MLAPVPAVISALSLAIHSLMPSSLLKSKPLSRPIITNDLAIPKLAGSPISRFSFDLSLQVF